MRSIAAWARRALVGFGFLAGVLTVAGVAGAAENKEKGMSYGEAKAFLQKYTDVVELSGPGGARVAVCPAYQGRVMTSTCGGDEGLSFGFINADYIAEGKTNLHFNNYGGEERLWLSPEGGPFSLWFKPGVEQTLADWYTPPGFNVGAWEVTSRPSDPYCRMTVSMEVRNASDSAFDLKLTRTVRMLEAEGLARLIGREPAGLVTQHRLKSVAFETENELTNQGQPMTAERGLISIWILGMLNASPKTVVIVPYRQGPESELGKVVESGYFGQVPSERLKVTDDAILFSADANFRSKIGTSQRRAKPVLGSIDFENNVLTIVHFNMPEDPAQHRYMNNQWVVPQPQPYVGDVVNAYNDGPPAPGAAQMGKFYEIESLSPAKELDRGQSLVHLHRTIHIQGELAVLDRIARQVLGTNLESVRRAMLDQ